MTGPSLWSWLVCAALAISCAGDETSAVALLDEGCALNSDCNAGLVCAFGVCREACTTSKDCPSGRCVLDADRVHSCRGDDALTCGFHSDCAAPLVCGLDGRCRNQCAADRDCVAGQVCVAATCADPDELDASGRLPLASDDPIGKRCLYSSECPPSKEGLVLECKQGVCAYACFEERDCPRYHVCTTAADPDAPGNCELIGPRGQLFCDPDDPIEDECTCPDNTKVPAVCRPDGSGYDCPCN